MKTTVMLAVLMMISLASGISLYSGESYSFESVQFNNWTIVGNSSDISGMNITYENGNTTIYFDPLFQSDSFTLLFWEDQEVIVEYIYVGGGGGGGRRTVYRDVNNTIYLNKTIYEKGDETEIDGTRIGELEDELKTQRDRYEIMKIIAILLCMTFLFLLVRKLMYPKSENKLTHKLR